MKQLIVCKAMLFRERADRQIRGDQVAVDAGKTVGIQVFQIRRFHVLAEEPAEIFRLQRDNIGSLLQRNRPLVIFLRVRQNRIEPCLRPGAHRVVRKRALLRKFRVEQIEKRKKLPLERQQIAVGHFLMKLHHRKQKTPELADIFLHFRIRTVVVNREPEL